MRGSSGAVWFPQACVSLLAKLILLFGTTAYGIGFLPISIRTVVEVPASTPTDLPVFSVGETFNASMWFKAIAARICSDCWSAARSFTDSNPPGVSTDTTMPVDTLRSTAKSLSWWILTCEIPIRIAGPLILFQPAASNTSLICHTRSKHSWSSQVPTKTYSVPWYVFSGTTVCDEYGKCRGVVSRSSSAVTSFARFIASLRCDSASVACCLADAMSFSNESASFWAESASMRAAPAKSNALEAPAVAALDAAAAPLADACASLAR